MKGFVEAIQEEDLYLTKPSLKATGGQIYRKKHKNMWKNVISAKDLHQIYISQEESLIPYLALGHLLNRA